MKRIAIISDLHIGAGARSSDLDPRARENGCEDLFIDKFAKFCRDENISADYLVIAGDLTNRADDAEVEYASDVLLDICKAVEVSEGNVIYVPGNHDANWKKAVADIGGGSERYKKFLEPGLIFHDLDAVYSGELYSGRYLDVAETEDLVVVRYNSAHADMPDSKPHNGVFDLSVSDELRDVVKHSDPNKYRVFVTHHHPFMYPNFFPGNDYSAMQNADELINILVDCDFDIFIHGHRHVPHFKAESRMNNKHVIFIGSGSFSARLGEYLSQSSSNQFHVLDIYGRNSNGEVKGVFRSWSYTFPHGWMPSRCIQGGGKEDWFGCGLNGSAIKDRIVAVIKDDLAVRNIIKWSSVVLKDEELGFLNGATITKWMSAIGVEYSYELLTSIENEKVLLPK